MHYLLPIFIALFVWAVYVVRLVMRNILEMPEVALDLTAVSSNTDIECTEEEVTISEKNGRQLTALKVTFSKSPPKLWILFLPETGTDATTWKKYLSWTKSIGAGILALNFPGSGSSSPYNDHKVRKFLSNRELEDVKAAFQYAATLSEQKKPAVFGVSRGAVAALTLAREKDCLGIIADSPFYSSGIISANFRRIARVYTSDFTARNFPNLLVNAFVSLGFFLAGLLNGCKFIHLLKELRSGTDCPILIINGTNDKFSTTHQIQSIVSTIPDAEHLEIEGAGHNGGIITDHKRYVDTVSSFIQSATECQSQT